MKKEEKSVSNVSVQHLDIDFSHFRPFVFQMSISSATKSQISVKRFNKPSNLQFVFFSIVEIFSKKLNNFNAFSKKYEAPKTDDTYPFFIFILLLFALELEDNIILYFIFLPLFLFGKDSTKRSSVLEPGIITFVQRLHY